jgi:hypothetical protein
VKVNPAMVRLSYPGMSLKVTSVTSVAAAVAAEPLRFLTTTFSTLVRETFGNAVPVLEESTNSIVSEPAPPSITSLA